MKTPFWKHPHVLEIRKRLTTKFHGFLKVRKQLKKGREERTEARRKLEFYGFTRAIRYTVRSPDNPIYHKCDCYYSCSNC